MLSSTNLLKMLGIPYPILSAPMANVSGGVLAQAVSLAGGLGFIGVGYNDANWLQQQILLAAPARIGIGFITWQLAQNPDLLTLALNHQPIAIMLSFGDPEPFIVRIKATGTKLICQVQTVKEARHVAQCGADIIVAQGSEAGGHGASRGTFALVPAVVDAVAPIPVIAAGGIVDGRGLAAALMLGAQGVLMGTRFYACLESLGHAKAKQLLVDTDGDQTIRSSLFDEVRGLNWQKPFTARSLKNKFTEQRLSGSVCAITDSDRLEYQQAVAAADFSIAGVFAGEGIDLIQEILSADAIMKKTMGEAQNVLNSTITAMEYCLK